MAHSRNHNGSAPWDDRDESRDGWLDDVSHRGLDDASRPQPEAEVFALSSSGLPHAGDGESELNESRDDTGENQSHLGHHAWNSNEDGQWMVGSDDQDDLFQEVSSRPAMFSTHAPSDGDNRGGHSLEAEDRTDDGKPAGFSDREGPGSSAHEVRDAGAEDHRANATELQNHLDHSQQVLDDRDAAGDDQQEDAHDADAQNAQALNEHHEEHDSQGQEGSQHCGEQSGNEGLGGQEDDVPAPGSAHEARDGAGDDQQEDAHDADAQDAQALNEHHKEHDSQGQEGSQHCGEQPGNEGSGGQEDDVPAPDGSAHEAASSVDEDHTQDHCNDSQQISDNNDESPDHDKDHTNDPGRGRGEHAAQDGDQQGDVHEVNAEDAQEVQQTANEHHQEHDRQGEGSHHCGDQSGDAGLGTHDDAVAAFLSSDTLPWKESSEWCASAMGTTPDEHDRPQVSSLLEAWGDEGGMHCEAVGQDDTPEVTHTNAFAIGQSDHGLLSL